MNQSKTGKEDPVVEGGIQMVCGLTVTVDEDCDSAELDSLVCCGEQMKIK